MKFRYLSFCLACLPIQAQSEPVSRPPLVFRMPSSDTTSVSPSHPVSFGFTDEGVRYLVEIDGERVVATVDGKQLPPDRLRRQANRIEVLDPAGIVMSRITLSATGGSLQAFPNRHRCSLGVRLLPATKSARPPGLDDAAEFRLVAAVLPGMGAESAGLRAGDLLWQIAGAPFDDAHVRQVLSRGSPGDRVKVRAFRGTEDLTFDVELRPAADSTGSQPSVPIELRDGMLVMLGDDVGRGAPASAADQQRELHEIRQRLQKLEELLQQLVAREARK